MTTPLPLKVGDRVRFNPDRNYPFREEAVGKIFYLVDRDPLRSDFDYQIGTLALKPVMWAARRELRKLPSQPSADTSGDRSPEGRKEVE